MILLSRKTMLIVNPVSGKAKARLVLMKMVASLGKGGEPVTVFVTEKRGDATAFARQYGPSFDRLVCTGGDGTINEVISGLMELPFDERPALGYIPLGTTNDMASTFGIPAAPDQALAIAAESEPHTIDIGLLGEHYFGYVAAFGAFSDISFKTPQEEKNALGYLAYLLNALSTPPNLSPYHLKVEHDGGELEGDFIFGAVVNSTSVAGFMKLKEDDVQLDDGVFEVVLIKSPANVFEFNECATELLSKKYNTKHIILLHTSKASFTFDRPAEWTRDGEDGGKHQTVTAVNCHNVIRMIYSPKLLRGEQK